MAVLGQEPGISADTVCSRTEMDKVTVSRAVARLLEKSYVHRDFSPHDRRRSMLRLSRGGYAVYARIIPIAHRYESGLMEVLSAAEQQALDRLLEKLDRRAAGLMDRR